MKDIQHSFFFLKCLVLSVFVFYNLSAVFSQSDSRVKPRIIVLTDGEKDDRSSMIRFLLYTCDFDVFGIIQTNSKYQTSGHSSEKWLEAELNAYEQVLPNLKKHVVNFPGAIYPEASYLRTVMPVGNENKNDLNVAPPDMATKNTAGEQLIIATLLDNDPRPVHVTCWGGVNTIASALWRLKYSGQYTTEQFNKAVSKVRIYCIWYQDGGGQWIEDNVKEAFINEAYKWDNVWDYDSYDNARAGKLSSNPAAEQEYMKAAWLNANVKTNHGVLGAMTPQTYVSEGDSPSFFALINNGLNQDLDYTLGGWGGRSRYDNLANTPNHITDASGVSDDGNANKAYWRWLIPAQNDFSARMDWCVAANYADANHQPIARIVGDNVRYATIGEIITLDASPTTDPDGNDLSYNWWQYYDADNATTKLTISNNTSINNASFVVPNEPGKQLHVICEVTDNGSPQLKSYQRILFNIISGSLVTVSAVSINPTTLNIINNGTSQLTATVLPSNATNKSVVWNSSNPLVATVSSTGLVTGVSGGTTIITATTQDGGKTASSEVTVTIVNIPVSGISVSPTTAKLNIGQKTQLTTTIEPSNASNKIVSWSSGNNSIATVSSTGLVTGLSEGTTAITATTEDGAKVAACEITVIYSPLPTPLIKLDFDENTGSSIANKGSVSATLTKTDIPVWSANIPENGGTSALDFGTTVGNNYVESAAIINELANLTSFTITGWVNCRNSTVGSGGNRIVSWINNGANGADVVYMSDGSLKLGVNEWPDKTTAISSTGKITTDANAGEENWKFFAVTYQSTTGATEFYFGNNSTLASLDKSFTYNKGAVGAAIGKLAVGHFNAESSRTTRTDRMFKGLIDQIQVFGTVLTAQEIQLVQNIETVNGVSKMNDDFAFKTYPNPVVDKLNIELDQELTSDVTIQLYDNMGRFVLNTKSNSEKLTLNLKDFHSGIYLLRVSNSKKSCINRIIKQ